MVLIINLVLLIKESFLLAFVLIDLLLFSLQSPSIPTLIKVGKTFHRRFDVQPWICDGLEISDKTFNPKPSKINTYILHTALQTFSVVTMRRIC